MLYFMKVLQADFIATGHYAGVIQMPNGRYTVQTAVHAEKDQTYMLYRLTQEQLARTLMPLSGYSKEEVRAMAHKFDLAVAEKPDSQELCFVPEGNYGDFIRCHAPVEVPGEGDFVDESGRILGRHRGILHYNVGQRRGLGIAAGERIFVTEIRPEENQVVLGPEESLYREEIRCTDLNFLSIPDPESGTVFRCQAKIRYHHPAVAATVTVTGDDNVLVRFDTPVRAPAPGQSAVFYDDDRCVIGGGIIA
jgi:tRNA-specific 2-thiouridylase